MAKTVVSLTENEVENYSSWLQTENDSCGGTKMWYSLDNVGQTDKCWGWYLWTSDRERQ